MNIRKLGTAACILFSAAAMAHGQTDTPAANTPPPKYDPASVARGKETFVGACGFCHGSNAKGGEKGPDLLRSVIVLDDENGKLIGPVILRGRPDKGMPRFPYSPQQIADISNFLHNSILKAADRDSYQILNIVTGNAKLGEAYFNAQCVACHSVSKDLKGIGTKYEPVTLQGKFLEPNSTWTEGTPPHTVNAITVTVTLPSGASFTGVPLNYDDFNVSLREPNGAYRSFKRVGDVPRVQINNRLQFHLDLLKHIGDADIHNLTAYLVTVK